MFRVPEFLVATEVWIGLILSLMTLSIVIRENIFSRLAQYILVGASTGYLAVIVIQNILRPQLFEPVVQNTFADITLLIPLLLGLLLLAVGTVRIFQAGGNKTTKPESLTRRILYSIGTIPVALLLGASLATAITGSIQGTLLPQFLRAAQMGFTWNESGADLLSGLITLLVTIGVFLHLYAMPAQRATNQQSTHPEQADLPEQARMTQLQSIQDVDGPTLFEQIVSLWAGLGKRMLWLAAGVLFARLVASRLSLLIAQFENIASALKTTQLWQAIISLIQ